MIYTKTEKKELNKVLGVFAEHLRQCPDFELLWSDKVGYVWLAIGLEPLYVDTGRRIESAEDLCRECLESIGMDVLYITDNDHGLENADPTVGQIGPIGAVGLRDGSLPVYQHGLHRGGLVALPGGEELQIAQRTRRDGGPP